MTTYRVVVGNIGEVYSGTDVEDARSTFNVYVEQSKQNSGRAAGEDVTLFAGENIAKEYTPGNVADFEVIDHGEDSSQYFPGIPSGKWEHKVTGVGDTGAEALEDALESMAQDDAHPSKLQEVQMRDALRDPDKSAFDSLDHSECRLDSGGFDIEEHDWSHWVSIRYNVRES